MKLAPLSALLIASALTSSCISIKSVDDDQVPAAWRQATSSKATKPGDFNGRFFPDGQVVRSDGKVAAWTLLDLFLPGRYMSRHQPYVDVCELRLAVTGRLTFTAFQGGAIVDTESFDTEFDSAAGVLTVKSIPVSDKFDEFGRVASTRSARLQIGSDQALYSQVRQTGAGVVLLMPVAGTSSMWARWEPASR